MKNQKLTISTLSIVILNLVLQVCALKSCLHGSFRQNLTCKPCKPGTYSDDFNLLECKPCQAGYFRSTPGASSEGQCLQCPPNTFAKDTASTKCTRCPPGMRSAAGSKRCFKSCPPGTELDSFGCSRCGRDYYGDGMTCRSCPDGTLAEPGSGACQKCPPGTFKRRSEFGIEPDDFFLNKGCIPCQAGTFSDQPGAISCKICPPGTFAKAGAKRCTPCEIGTFSATIPANSCRKCPVGTATAASGAAACRHPLRGCTYNTFENKKGVCQACKPGERLDRTRKECIACAKDEFSSGGIDTECKKCPPRQAPLGDLSFLEASACDCAPGFIHDGRSCVICPAGSFWRNDDSLTFDLETDNYKRSVGITGECVACDEGTFSDKPGMLSCKQCPMDTFMDRYGATKCLPCLRGYKSPRGGFAEDRSRCVDDENVCRPGEIRKRGLCVAKSCPREGTFLRGEECIRCEIDSIRMGNKCKKCKKNEFAKGNNCVKCPKDKIRNVNHARDLGPICTCPSFTLELNGRCLRSRQDCPRGYRELSDTFFELDVCARCPIGTVGNGYDCSQCDSKFFIPNKDRTNCVLCPKGLVSEVNVLGNSLGKCRAEDPYV